MLERVRGDIKSYVLPLGGQCECPGFVHKSQPVPLDDGYWTRVEEAASLAKQPKPEHRVIKGDYVVYKDRLLYGDWRKINSAEPDERESTLFLRALLDWNIVDGDGDTLPLTLANLDRLSLFQSAVLVGNLDTPEYALGAIMVADPNPGAGDGTSQPPATTTNESSDVGPEGSSS